MASASPIDGPVHCPHCGAVATGRFCSACGKEVALHATAGAVVSDALGVKAVPLAAYGRTAWLALVQPDELSRRWIANRRVGLVSPIAMLSAVTLVTALASFVLARWTGYRDAKPVFDVDQLLVLAPFLKTSFPQALAAAGADRAALMNQFQTTGNWFAVLWPSLLIAPGWLAMAPWRRLDHRGALIFACVESVFLLMLTGLQTALKMVAPGLMASGLATTALAVAVFAHGGVHCRGLTGSGWGYALTRPLLAALWILPVAYLWVVFVLAVTLALWT